MKIVNEATLDKFRMPGRCELCQKQCRVREPHHHQRKGHGGGYRLDVSIGLISLGPSQTFVCVCHARVTDGDISDARVLEVIAKRHATTPDAIQEALWVLARLPKRASVQEIEEEIAGVDGEVSRLVVEALHEAGVMA
jgi:hypothetical protein